MSGDVIVTVTLNAALHVAYGLLIPGGTIPPDPPAHGADERDHVDLAAYERLLGAVRVESPTR